MALRGDEALLEGDLSPKGFSGGFDLEDFDGV